MSNMGLQVMDSADSMETHQYTFGGLAEVYSQFMMDVAGAARIPVTKLFGRSPSGLNATGESDLQNYYDMIGEEQESKLRPILDKLLPVVCMSAFGAVPDDLDYDFDPVSEPDDKERAELAKTGTDNVVAALNAGLVSKQTALKELKQQSERTGVWTNITDEDIAKASDAIESEGELDGLLNLPQLDFQKAPGRDSDENWEEDKHPRAENGEFGNGGSSEKNSTTEKINELLGEKFEGLKGSAAVNKLMTEKHGHIPDAFHRKDIGAITLVYGNEKIGLAHIVKRRQEEGLDIDAFLPKLPDLVENGSLVATPFGRFEVKKDGLKAIITPTLFDQKLTMLLTAFQIKNKK